MKNSPRAFFIDREEKSVRRQELMRMFVAKTSKSNEKKSDEN